MSGRNHSREFKLKVALAAIKEDKTLAELCQQFDLHKSVIGRWKKQLVENGAMVFREPEAASQQVQNQTEVDQLYAKIGELVMERDYLKKVLDA
jgi:transposase-like protein